MYDMFCSTGNTPYKRRHCDRCGKCFTKTTFLKMHKFHHSGAKPFLQEKLRVLREIVSKINFPDDSHVLLTQEKRLTIQDCDICGKYFTKTTVTMMHKFRHEAIFRRRIESFCEKLFAKPISPMSYMFTNTGEKPYKRSHCNKCGKYLQNRRIKDAQILPFLERKL